MTNDILVRIADEIGCKEHACGRCKEWAKEHTDDGRAVYTMKCSHNGTFTHINDTCEAFSGA